MRISKEACELDHPCKETCSGWKQGFEKGRLACPKCSDLFYDPRDLIESEKQRAAEWEETAKKVTAEHSRLMPLLEEAVKGLRAGLDAIERLVPIFSPEIPTQESKYILAIVSKIKEEIGE